MSKCKRLYFLRICFDLSCVTAGFSLGSIVWVTLHFFTRAGHHWILCLCHWGLSILGYGLQGGTASW